MTEEEWLTATDPEPMILGLKGKITERKSRLFVVSFLRTHRHLMSQQLRGALEVGARYADGSASEKEICEAINTTHEEGGEANLLAMGVWTTMALMSEEDDPWAALRETVSEVNPAAALRSVHSQMLRDIFGNPFHPVAFNASWRTSTVSSLAAAAYEERLMPSGLLDNHRLAVLADALEESGCDNGDILNHCRKPGEHIRGCWVIDLVMGKE